VPDDPLDDLDAAGEDLIRLYEMADVPAILMTLKDGQLYVRCVGQEHVPWMCRRVLEQYEAPPDRVVN
jgi:hypothetical protein